MGLHAFPTAVLNLLSFGQNISQIVVKKLADVWWDIWNTSEEKQVPLTLLT